MKNSIELIGYYGSDEVHACSAWTSTNRDLTEEKRGRIPALLSMLAREGHHTPFEKSSLHFLVNSEIASHIHMLKHRIGVSINGECLAGDTIIYLVNDKKEHVTATIKDLFYNFEKKYYNHKVIVLNEGQNRVFEHTDIKYVMYSGKKEMYTCITNSGLSLRCSADHLILTQKGWKPLKNIALGEQFYTYSEKYARIPSFDYFVSLTKDKLEDCYDIEVDHPAHNFVAQGIVVHNSARYKEIKEDKHYVPLEFYDVNCSNEFLEVLAGIKHVSVDELKKQDISWGDVLDSFNNESHLYYHYCLKELEEKLGRKRAKESARFFKTYSSQIQCDIMFNWRSFYHFLSLRNSPHAQKEIREIAQNMLDCVEKIEGNPFRYTIEAFKPLLS